MIGRRAKLRHGLAWAADFRDPLAAGKWGKKPSFWEKRREQSIVAEADLIIANAPRAADALRERYFDFGHRVVTVPNGYDPDIVVPRVMAPSDRPLRIVHTGEIYAGRDPRMLLDGIAALSSNSIPLALEFIGRVNEIDLQAEAKSRGLQVPIHVVGQRSAADALRASCEADILLLLDTPGRRIGVPAKLYEYIGAGRPILALAEHDSDTAWALEESGVRYALAPPRDVKAIALAITKVVDMAKTTTPHVSPNAARFTRAGLAAELSEHLSKIASRRVQSERTGLNPMRSQVLTH